MTTSTPEPTPPLTLLRGVAREEIARWLTALRTTAAVFIALGIALRLDLGSPSSAAMTVIIISLPQTGMVLEKSFYRLLGTLIGAGMTLVFLSLLAQLRDLFILAVALWVGFCVACSAWFRNFQSYAWALAGYTTCLIGFPAFDQVENSFNIVTDRVTIVALGILCGGIVNAVVFPSASRDYLVQSVRRSFRDFTDIARFALGGYRNRGALHETQQRFLTDILALETVRASSFFEDPESRIRTPRLRRFISEFMATSTTAHAINRLRGDLRQRGLDEVLEALRPLYEHFLQALLTAEGAVPESAQEATPIPQQLERLLREWDQHALRSRARLFTPEPGYGPRRRELDSALALLREFVEEAHGFAATYAGLQSRRGPRERGGGRPSTRAEHGNAVVAGLRTALTLASVCAFWILSGWPDGYSAALLSAVACSLFINAPSPLGATWQMVRGFALGLIASFVCFTFVLPAMDGFALMAAGMAPFLLVGTYLLANPASAGLGSGYCLMFLVSLGISDRMRYDVVNLLNGGLAQIVGVGAAAIAFSVLLPANTPWRARRIERALLGELELARTGRLRDLRHRFESGARDLTLQFASLPGSDEEERRRRVIAGLVVLEAGRAIIALRHLRERPSLATYNSAVSANLARATRAFMRGDNAEQHRALAALDGLCEDVEKAQVLAPTPDLIELRTALRLLRLALAERAAPTPDADEEAALAP